MNELDKIIQELERLISLSKKRAFSNEISLDKDALIGLAQAMKQEIPESIREAQFIVANQEKIIGEANAEADRIVDEANAMASKFLSETNLINIAKEEADNIVNEAQKFRDEVEYTAKINIDEMLGGAESSLIDALNFVRNNREELRGSLLRNNRKDQSPV